MLVSPHAVTRFVQRYRPDLTEKAAAPVLALLASSAKRVGPTEGGDLYRVELDDGRRVSMVMRDDPKTDRVVVTVLPPSVEPMPAEEADEVLEAFERLSTPPNPVKARRPGRGELKDKITKLAIQLEAQERKTERSRRHAERKTLEYEIARDALRIAVRALRRTDTDDAREAIGKIAAIEPRWVSDSFVSFEQTEEQRAARIARMKEAREAS